MGALLGLCKKEKKQTHWQDVCSNEEIDNKELQDSLLRYWTLVISVSGLIAGFSYFISNNQVTFISNDQQWIPVKTRHDIFGGLLITTFALSILSTVMGCALFYYFNLVGDHNTKWLLKQYWYLADVPLMICITSITLMFIAGLISVGGLYSTSVWYYAFILSISVFVMYFIFIFKLDKTVKARMKQEPAQQTAYKMNGHQKKRDDSEKKEEANQHEIVDTMMNDTK